MVSIVVLLKAMALREARQVEPVSPPAFAIVRTCEEPINQAGPGLRRGIRGKGVDGIGGGRQANDAEVGAAHLGSSRGRGIGREVFLFQAPEQEAVDLTAAPRTLLRLLRGLCLQRLEGPPAAMLLRDGQAGLVLLSLFGFQGTVIGRTEVNPASEEGDLFSRKFRALMGHVRLGLVRDHPVQRAFGMSADQDSLSFGAALDEARPG